MAVSVAAPAAPLERVGRATIPWYIWAALFAATSAVVGVIWDISWHRSIGRDTFWTPAHMAIYLGGVVAGLSCGWLALRTTFAGTPGDHATSVRFWGFRAPLGAWVSIWGAFAMIVSAPLDNWWHNAYGLDVKVLSPPHVILALGFYGIQLGAMLLVLARQNRTPDPAVARRYGLLFLYGAGILLQNVAILGIEQIGFPNDARTSLYYQVAAAAFPLILVAVARASKARWPATTAALVYMGISLAMIWTLPLFPATAKLAPVYRPITSMVPPPFPLLLVVPALAVDLLLHKLEHRLGDWTLSAVIGLAFLATFFVTQYVTAAFLISPGANTFLFGAQKWNYNSLPGPWQHRFWRVAQDPVTAKGLALAALFAVTGTRLGLWRGAALARVKR